MKLTKEQIERFVKLLQDVLALGVVIGLTDKDVRANLHEIAAKMGCL